MHDPLQARVAVLFLSTGDEAANERTRQSLRQNGIVPAREIVEIAAGTSFPAALAEAAAKHAQHDLVVVTSGADLPYAWDARLAKAAYAAPRIAAVVPLCDASPLHFLVAAEQQPAIAGRAAVIDRSAYAMGTRGYYETPALHPFCAYLRRDALALGFDAQALSPAAPLALNQLARRWRSLGWQAVLCDYLYVAFDGAGLEGAQGVDEVEASAFARHSPLGALRRSVRDAIAAGLPPVSAPALDGKPVQLHVMHFWGGGLDKWVRDFARADHERTNLMLATYRIGEGGGQRIVLYSDPDARIPIRVWDIARPLRSTAVACGEYARILRQIVEEFRVESIIVSSLIGHSLEALAQPVKTVVVCHDFYPLCQAINPRFDERCAGCTPADLASCSASNPHWETLGSPTPEEWAALREAYVRTLVERHLELVAPSPSVCVTLQRLEPRMAELPLRIIGHGSDLAAQKLSAPSVRPGEPLRLVVLGRLPENKGAGLLAEAAAELAPLARITLVGCGPHAMALAKEKGWEAIENYELAQLPAIMRSLEPHAALLASVVPETFSYTLSELWALGVPPLATALGSFRDRIRDGVDGMLFEPRREALVALVRRIAQEPAILARIAAAIPPPGAIRTTRQMVEDYHALLPLATRPPVRFEVGAGTDTALTEPYRHLTEAYAELTEAYARMSEAYGKSRAAYDHARAEFDRVHQELHGIREMRDRCRSLAAELEALHVDRRWWRAAEAARLVKALRASLEQIESPAQQDVSTHH